MDDLISRAAAIEAAFKDADNWDGGFNPKHLRATPAVDAVPVAWLKKLCDSYDYNLFYSIPLKQVLKSWEIEKQLQNERRDSE